MKIAILGCGLIGCSLAAALRQRGLVSRALGYDSDANHAARALARGWIDAAAGTVAEAAREAEVVILAAPVGTMPALLGQVAASLRADAVVTDVGSTKRDVIDAARRGLGSAFERFVPAHPIAGSEKSGPEYADAGLFEGRVVITTATSATRPDALQRIEAMWRACGASIEHMDADQHDRVLASVSHLPHVLAFALVARIASEPDATLKFSLAGAGFRDFTRIAASSAAMWRDIALANREALGQELHAYVSLLQDLERALDAGDAPWLEQLFERASRSRQQQAGGAH
jgi:prephenate dehydrogenase